MTIMETPETTPTIGKEIKHGGAIAEGLMDAAVPEIEGSHGVSKSSPEEGDIPKELNVDEQRDPQEGTEVAVKDSVVVSGGACTSIDKENQDMNEGGDHGHDHDHAQNTEASLEGNQTGKEAGNMFKPSNEGVSTTEYLEEEKMNAGSNMAAVEGELSANTPVNESEDDCSNINTTIDNTEPKNLPSGEECSVEVVSTSEGCSAMSLPTIIRTADEPADKPLKPSGPSGIEPQPIDQKAVEFDKIPQDKPDAVTKTKETIEPTDPERTSGRDQTTKRQSSGGTFADAFGTRPPIPPVSPLTTPRRHSDIKYTKKRPSGLTFAEAFGGKPTSSPLSPIYSPSRKKLDDESGVTTPATEPLSTKSDMSLDDSSSHSALSAVRTRRVSGRVSKYLETVTKEPLPGDAVKLVSTPSPTYTKPIRTPDAFSSPKTIRSMSVPNIDSNKNVGSIRARFEKSSQTSASPVFEFGEAFRQKQRFSNLCEKEKESEAKTVMRGFDEKITHDGKAEVGEVDSSNLGKTFVFEGTTDETVALNAGICKVDYKTTSYEAGVFIIHRTRGMLLLHGHRSKGVRTRRCIPMGKITEDEFKNAAKQVGSAYKQLELACREGAARIVHVLTGIDVRHALERFQPAVLNNTSIGTVRGASSESKGKPQHDPRNMHGNRLYYFLSIDDNDCTAVAESTELVLLKNPVGDSDGNLKLKINEKYSKFEFVPNPLMAAKILKKYDTESNAGDALVSILDQTATTNNRKNTKNGQNEFDRLVLDNAAKESALRTKKKKEESQHQTGVDDPTATVDEGVSCCCSFWGRRK